MSEKKHSPMGVLFLTLFMDLVGFSIIFPLFPDMLEYYLGLEEEGGVLSQLVGTLKNLSGADTGSQDIYAAVLFGGFLGSLYSLLQFLFAPVWGGLSDRIGRRPVLVISITGAALSYLLWFFSGSFLLVTLSRLLGGCMSGNIATASAAVADVTTERDRAKGMGLIGAAFGLGFILGPALGAFSSRIDLVEKFPAWESYGVNPFSVPALVALLISVVNLLWVTQRFKETLSEENRGRARESKRSINPLVLFRKIELVGVTATNFAYFLFVAAFSGIEFTLTFFAKERFSYTHESMWVIFVFMGLIMAFIQGGVVRRVAPRFGERRVAAFGLLALIPAYLIIAFSPPSKGLLFSGLGLMAIGSALVTPCLTAVVSLYTPADRQGAILGVFRSLGAFARAVGPIIFAAIYWKFGQVEAYVAGGALLILPVVLAIRLPQPQSDARGQSSEVRAQT